MDCSLKKKVVDVDVDECSSEEKVVDIESSFEEQVVDGLFSEEKVVDVDVDVDVLQR